MARPWVSWCFKMLTCYASRLYISHLPLNHHLCFTIFATMRKPVAAYQISIVSQWLKGRVFCLLFAKEVTQDVRQERTKELLLSKLYPSASLVK